MIEFPTFFLTTVKLANIFLPEMKTACERKRRQWKKLTLIFLSPCERAHFDSKWRISLSAFS